MLSFQSGPCRRSARPLAHLFFLSDYKEVINRHTDPNNSDTNAPMVWIAYPADASMAVWEP